jgi:hypothetical protein
MTYLAFALWAAALSGFAWGYFSLHGTFKRKPQPGEVWSFLESGDPWDGGFTVKVLEVREGWVRYDMGGPFSDSRMKMSSFLYCYAPPEPEPKNQSSEIEAVGLSVEQLAKYTGIPVEQVKQYMADTGRRIECEPVAHSWTVRGKP